MSWLDQQLFGVRRVLAAGVQLAERGAINFASGFTVVDNPTTGTTDVSAAAAADATTLAKGLVKLAGSLSGTADLPTVTKVDGDGSAQATIAAARLSVVDGFASIDSIRGKVATTNTTATTILTLPIPTGAFARVDVLVIARDSSTGRRTFQASRTCENVAGAVGGVTTIGTDTNTGTGAHAISFVASGENLLVQVTGTSLACDWLAIADVKGVT
jgi:hypothetical protein